MAQHPPLHAGLALSLGDIFTVERRMLERSKPRRSLRAQLALPRGSLLSGDVVNLSLGGFAARVDQPLARGTAIAVTLFDCTGAPVLLDLAGEVRRCIADDPDGHVVSVSFRSRGVAAMTLARLR